MPRPTPLPRFTDSDRWLAARLLALALVIFGAKLLLISLYSSPLPFFDQWQGEGKNLLLPWLEGRLTWRDFFDAHNEHRKHWTRLLVLGLFQLNGQWDAQVGMIAAAALHAGCAVVLGWIIIRRLGRAWTAPVLLTLGLTFALPFDWEDTLTGGFQSLFYFLLLFATVGLWGLGGHPPLSAKWWIGAGAMIAAWLSTAAGPLATAAIAAWMLLRFFLRIGAPRANLATLGVALALTAAGLGIVPEAGMPGDLKPRSPLEFLNVFCGLLSWPLQWPPGVLFMWLPFAVFVGRMIATRPSANDLRAADFFVPFGLWIILQAAALGYARNRYNDPLAISRYMVFLAPGLLVNLGCAALLLRDWRPAFDRLPARRRFFFAGALAALPVLVLGHLGGLTTENLQRQLPLLRINNQRQRENIHAFLASGGNPEILAGKTSHDLQAEVIPELMELLRHPVVRRILPTPAQLPLPVEVAQNRGFELVARRPAIPGEVAEPAWKTDLGPGRPSAAFRSQPFTSPLPYLEFSVAGRIGTENAALALVGVGGTQPLPPRPLDPGSGWARIVVKAPSGPMHIEAVGRGDSSDGFAFTLPRPVGRLSAWGRALFDCAGALLFFGAALSLALPVVERCQFVDAARGQ